MYKKIVPWNTVLGREKTIELEHLIGNSTKVKLLFEVPNTRKKYRVTVEEGLIGYRNTDDSYKINLFNSLSEFNITTKSYIIEGSLWIEELKEISKTFNILDLYNTELKHYVIEGLNDIIEIIAYVEPIVEEVLS